VTLIFFKKMEHKLLLLKQGINQDIVFYDQEFVFEFSDLFIKQYICHIFFLIFKEISW